MKSVVRRDAACKAELSTATTLTTGCPDVASGASAACRATYHSTRRVTPYTLGNGRLILHKVRAGPGFGCKFQRDQGFNHKEGANRQGADSGNDNISENDR